MSEKAPINTHNEFLEKLSSIQGEKVEENYFGLNEQEIIDEQTEPGIHANKEAWIAENIRTLRGLIESTLRDRLGDIQESADTIEDLVNDAEVREKYSELRRAQPGEEKAFDFKQFLVDRITAIKAEKAE